MFSFRSINNSIVLVEDYISLYVRFLSHFSFIISIRNFLPKESNVISSPFVSFSIQRIEFPRHSLFSHRFSPKYSTHPPSTYDPFNPKRNPIIVTNGNTEFNPNYPCFRFFGRREIFLSTSLFLPFFPSRDQPLRSPPQPLSNPITFTTSLFCFLNTEKIFVSPRLHFRLLFPPLSIIPFPARIQRATCLLFLFPPTLLVPSPALSRISSFRDPAGER